MVLVWRGAVVEVLVGIVVVNCSGGSGNVGDIVVMQCCNRKSGVEIGLSMKCDVGVMALCCAFVHNFKFKLKDTL